jgi:hypothetical protein
VVFKHACMRATWCVPSTSAPCIVSPCHAMQSMAHDGADSCFTPEATLATSDTSMQQQLHTTTTDTISSPYLPDPPMVGIIEMGGASLQVTFQAKHQVPSPFMMPLLLPQHSACSLFTHSFQGWGREAAMRRIVTGTSSPCFNTGYTSTTGEPCFLQHVHITMRPILLQESLATAAPEPMSLHGVSCLSLGEAQRT